MQVSTKLFNQQSVNQFGKLTEEIQKLQGKRTQRLWVARFKYNWVAKQMTDTAGQLRERPLSKHSAKETLPIEDQCFKGSKTVLDQVLH